MYPISTVCPAEMAARATLIASRLVFIFLCWKDAPCRLLTFTAIGLPLLSTRTISLMVSGATLGAHANISSIIVPSCYCRYITRYQKGRGLSLYLVNTNWTEIPAVETVLAVA